MQLIVGYNGEVQRGKVKKTKQTFEEKLRAETLALQTEQYRVVPEDWIFVLPNLLFSCVFVVDVVILVIVSGAVLQYLYQL